MHRPPFVHSDQGALRAHRAIKEAQGCDIAFNELSGWVAIHSCDQEEGVYTLAVYEGAAGLCRDWELDSEIRVKIVIGLMAHVCTRLARTRRRISVGTW